MAIKSNISDFSPSREKYKRDIDIPSGLWYAKDKFPDGKLTVFPWDMDVNNRFMKILNRVKSSSIRWQIEMMPLLADLKGLEPKNFLANETALVMMISRALVGNGKIEVEMTCPECGHVNKAKLDIPDNLERIGAKPAGYIGYDVIRLPSCGDYVAIRPQTLGDILACEERDTLGDSLKGVQMPQPVLQKLYCVYGVGTSADDLGRPDNITEVLKWFNSLPPSDAECYSTSFEEVQPGVSSEVNWTCDSCGHEFTHRLELNRDFFRRRVTRPETRALDEVVQPSANERGSTDSGVDESTSGRRRSLSRPPTRA
jgi:predicted RNA-binding Zn-ribbon protein involved in translation (DUF1610 family)